MGTARCAMLTSTRKEKWHGRTGDHGKVLLRRDALARQAANRFLRTLSLFDVPPHSWRRLHHLGSGTQGAVRAAGGRRSVGALSLLRAGHAQFLLHVRQQVVL